MKFNSDSFLLLKRNLEWLSSSDSNSIWFIFSLRFELFRNVFISFSKYFTFTNQLLSSIIWSSEFIRFVKNKKLKERKNYFPTLNIFFCYRLFLKMFKLFKNNLKKINLSNWFNIKFITFKEWICTRSILSITQLFKFWFKKRI